MRWYEWLAALLLLFLVGGARAQPVYKCTDADGAVAYQDKACSAPQREQAVTMPPAPPPHASPQYALAPPPAAAPARDARGGSRRRRWADDEPMSFECRVSNGDVFYRHAACPKSIRASAPAADKAGRTHAASGSAAPLTVAARPIPRAEACAAIHRAGAIGRNGHEHDDTVSTYEHNLGRDPCR